ncbi:MAG: NAD(P)H-binding protein [bacterium]|nr:NAD(P)H-binding protein [bacterium]
MILVTGSTGFIGRHLVAQLMAQGRAVRILIPPHKVNRLPWPQPPEVIPGSILDDEALFKAATGAHVVIHLENAFWWGRPRDLERVELTGTRQLITAARAARVGRMITLSHLGAAPSSAYALLRVKGQTEELIRASGLAYTILRSGLVFGIEDAFINRIAMQLRSNPAAVLMPGKGEIVLHPIHVDDVVAALAGSLDSIDVVDETIEIGGPEYITLEDLLRTVMRVSHASRVIVPVPPYVLRALNAVTSRLLPRSLMPSQWLDIVAANRTARLGTLYQYFGVRPKRLEDTLVTYMRGQHYTLSLIRYTLRRPAAQHK